MNQRFVEINNKKLPVIELEGVNYYPINFVIEKILMKVGSPIKILSQNYPIIKLKVVFGDKNVQISNCVNEDSLKDILNNSHIGRMDSNQFKINNELRKILGMELLQSKFSNKPSDEELSKYSPWNQECIRMDQLEDPAVEWQLCSICNTYYPSTDMFFNIDDRYPSRRRTECRCCMGREQFTHPDDKLDLIYRKFGYKTYISYREHDVIKIYEHWIETKYCHTTPQIIHNIEDYLKISQYVYEKCQYNKTTVSLSLIASTSQLTSYNHIVTHNMLYNYLFGDKPYHKPWEYTNYKGDDKSIEHAIDLFNTYLNEHNIIIEDIYTFNYQSIIKLARIHSVFNNDLLGFVMNVTGNKYASYRFKIHSLNYFKVKECRVQALKYFIEEDMNLPIEKVPLYVTLTSLSKFAGTKTMYAVCKNYYKSLFEWVNEVYPDRFDPRDFDINYFRNDFDSVEESQVHDILTSNLKNVLYNPRHTDRTIKLGGKIPDWIVFTDKNMYIIEYFGMTNDSVVYNSRMEMYKKKMANKMESYDNITYCKYIFLYPHDMVDNFKGILEKINVIAIEQN